MDSTSRPEAEAGRGPGALPRFAVDRSLRRRSFDRIGHVRSRPKKQHTTTLVAGLTLEGVVAPMTVDGVMTGTAFLAYVEQVLAPTDAGPPPLRPTIRVEKPTTLVPGCSPVLTGIGLLLSAS